MSQKKVEYGFVFNLSAGALKRVQFERQGDGAAWGINPEGRATWLAGKFTIGKDLFMTEGEAKSAADVARLKKLDSLRKQIAKLQKMTFKLMD